jgi:hypothetical protein
VGKIAGLYAQWWSKGVAEILLAKHLNGELASFFRSDDELFVVNVNGQERTISRDAWRLLPEQQIEAKDRVHYLDHHRGRRVRSE